MNTNEIPRARLLVVDDEAPLVAALRRTLPGETFDVTGVTAPRAALELMRRQDFDLLLTDLEMPETDGIQLLRSALSIDRWIMPIIMTGHGTIDTAVEAMKAGAFDYILKPFKLGVVLPVLARAIEVRRLRIENEALQQGLRKRTEELEAMNRDLEAFSYSVSHDLRAPVRAIGGFAGFLEDEIEKGNRAATHDLVARIRAGAQQMNDLIDDLLRLSRASQTKMRRMPVDLGAIARELADRFHLEAPTRVADWSIAGNLRVEGDLGLLRLAMENLLANAWKYTGKTERAQIEVGVVPGANGTTTYFVRDNGAGFDMRFADRLFAPFQRLHQQKDFPGTGVGLATVQRIIHKHGGRIWAESSPGHGATFLFTLPG